MENLMTNFAQANQVIQMIHLASFVFVGAMVGLKILWTVTNPASPPKAFLDRPTHLFPVGSLVVVLVAGLIFHYRRGTCWFGLCPSEKRQGWLNE